MTTFYELIQVDDDNLVNFDVRVLKYAQQDSEQHIQSNQPNCKWFRLRHWEEALDLIRPVIAVELKFNDVSHKQDRPKPSKRSLATIISGETVTIAYSLLPSRQPPRLTMVPKHEEARQSAEGKYRELHLNRTRVVLSIGMPEHNRVTNEKRLMNALSQPLRLTAASTIAVSHYFDKQFPRKTDGAVCTQPSSTTSTPEEMVKLRKIVSSGSFEEGKPRNPRKRIIDDVESDGAQDRKAKRVQKASCSEQPSTS